MSADESPIVPEAVVYASEIHGQNAFAALGAVDRALRKAGRSAWFRDQVQAEMMAGDYDHLLDVAHRTVTVL